MRRKSTYLIIAAVTLAITSIGLASPAPSLATSITQGSFGSGSSEVWGACGIWTKEAKIIRTYKRRGGAKVYLKCGGPKYTSDPTWGFRHIKRYHLSQFETMSFGTYQNWQQIADLAIATALATPERTTARDGKVCVSRTIKLYNVRTGREVDRATVRVIYRVRDSAIITAYPSAHCK